MGPRRNYKGRSPAPRGSEEEAPIAITSFSLPSSGYSYGLLPGRKGTVLAVPVEQQGLHQGDDISAGVMSCTDDGHLQELGRGQQVSGLQTGRTWGWVDRA